MRIWSLDNKVVTKATFKVTENDDLIEIMVMDKVESGVDDRMPEPAVKSILFIKDGAADNIILVLQQSGLLTKNDDNVNVTLREQSTRGWAFE